MISPNVCMISPDVLNIPQCTYGIPHMHNDIPQCTEILQCIHGIPPPQCTHGTVPNVLNTPDVLMIFSQCTEHPPM